MRSILFILVSTLLLIVCSPSNDQSSSTSSGSDIYREYCTLCHGASGDMGLNGAFKLTDSKLSLEERIIIISKGRNTMAAYNNILSEEEINAVAKYTMKLSTQK